MEEGKTPYSIGKELVALVEKWFSVSIPAETLKSRAYAVQKKSVESNRNPTTPCNSCDNPEKQSEQVVSGPADYPASPTAPGEK